MKPMTESKAISNRGAALNRRLFHLQ